VLDADGAPRGYRRRILDPTAPTKIRFPAGAPHAAHFVEGWHNALRSSGALLVTESPVKADVAARELGIAGIGVPSVGIGDVVRTEVAQAIDRERPAVLLLAPDFADLVDGEQRHDTVRRDVAKT